MSDVKHPRQRGLTAAAAGCSVALVMAGCSGADDASGSATPTTERSSTAAPDIAEPEGTQAPPSEAPSSSTVTPTDTRPPDVAAPDKVLLKSATTYLTARENASSHQQKDPFSWLDQAKPAMTSTGFKKMMAGYKNARPGGVWDAAHSKGLAVKVVLDCSVSEQGGTGKAERWLQCGVTDRTIGKDGKPLPLNQLPSAWPYSGEQQRALLQMKRQNGKWLVHGDYTGQAS